MKFKQEKEKEKENGEKEEEITLDSLNTKLDELTRQNRQIIQLLQNL